MEISASAVADPHGDGPMMVNVIRDVTEQRRAAMRDRLLADTGELLTRPAELDDRLARFAELAAPVLAELAVISLVELNFGEYGRARQQLRRRNSVSAGRHLARPVAQHQDHSWRRIGDVVGRQSHRRQLGPDLLLLYADVDEIHYRPDHQQDCGKRQGSLHRGDPAGTVNDAEIAVSASFGSQAVTGAAHRGG